MGQFLLLLVVALTVGAVVFGVTVLVSGGDQGLAPAEPDGRAVPLPGTRPLIEGDVAEVRFDTALRGYRMEQVDQALHRAAYDIGYKDELIGVLEAEVIALRDGRTTDADLLRQAREAALGPATAGRTGSFAAAPGSTDAREAVGGSSTGAAVAVLDAPADGGRAGATGGGEPTDVARPVDTTKAAPTGGDGGADDTAVAARGAGSDGVDGAPSTTVEPSATIGDVAGSAPAGAGGTADPDAIPASRSGGDTVAADRAAADKAAAVADAADEGAAADAAGRPEQTAAETGKAAVDRK
ncbi:hypothetical protein GCM10009779_26170 [Polymorphospora rubra]|uniref:DivIVA domain-containing protein n=1 Tax=Polymorphospora rubra TaxID=338584 RepID=A0A810N1W7_9ACTN|nr:hypothetical protein Prubr_32100 [Polymorphospora rubra]